MATVTFNSTEQHSRAKQSASTNFTPFDISDEMKFVQAVKVPLFDAEGIVGNRGGGGGGGVGVRQACGHVPVAMCYVRRERPAVLHRSTG